METEGDEIYWELNSDMLSRIAALRDVSSSLKLVHYTSSANLINLIRGGEFWLRNCRVMNDYREIEHGIEVIEELLQPNQVIWKLLHAIDQHHQGMASAAVRRFLDIRSALSQETFVGCFSEHQPKTGDLGRLSMWRAYAMDSGAALVLHPRMILRDETDLNIYAGAVRYGGREVLEERISVAMNGGLASSVKVRTASFSSVLDQLTSTFAAWALLLKHPGFEEECEWRIFANEQVFGPTKAKRNTEVIGGVPQEVLKIPLTKSDELDSTDLSLGQLIDRIIIGPCSMPEIIAAALRRELRVNGIDDQLGDIVRLSRIPLRTRA